MFDMAHPHHVPRTRVARTCCLLKLAVPEPVIERVNHERRSRHRGNECSARIEMKSTADNDKQKGEQAHYQQITLHFFLHCCFSFPHAASFALSVSASMPADNAGCVLADCSALADDT